MCKPFFKQNESGTTSEPYVKAQSVGHAKYSRLSFLHDAKGTVAAK